MKMKNLLIISLALILFNGCSDGSGGASNNEITYGTVTSPYTGKVWLDRNLGATRVCTTLEDSACFGDYYQWGRNTDGHQKLNSATTSTKATDINNAGSSFITSDYSSEWTTLDSDGAFRETSWSKTDGSSICPTGYRVPTITELSAETIDSTDGINNKTDAFNNFLKLPSAGFRFGGDGNFFNSGIGGALGFLWTNTIIDDRSDSFYFNANNVGTISAFRADAYPIRCIQDTNSTVTTSNQTPIAKAGTDQSITVGDEVTLDGSSSSDDGSIDSYVWSEGNTELSTAMSFTKNDFTVGAHTITLTVTDNQGITSTDNVIITVNTIITGTITHNGTAYDTVTSPYTGKIWLDRNLGAFEVCTALDDTACYGDYYQWGRNYDGHQTSTSTTTSTKATDINSAGSSFIEIIYGIPEWTTADSNGSLRATNWSKTDGSSVCPIGYRVPTITELKAETLDSTDGMNSNIDAFNNFLKLPSAGVRWIFGSMDAQGSGGSMWSSSVLDSDSDSDSLSFYSNKTYTQGDSRYHGYSVRCIQDSTPIAKAGTDQNTTVGDEVTLDGSASSDNDGSVDSYIWSEGSTELSTAMSFTKNNFTAGTHTITLTVTDNQGFTSTDNVIITVTGPIGTIPHNGTMYGTVTSPYTNKIWLDRNLGASQVCTAYNDSACYGDYYQWGRNYDGHQESNSATTSSQATDINSAGSSFITSSSTYSYDWAKNADSDGSLRSFNWSKIDGSSICPIGYRVPTITELSAETIDSTEGMSSRIDAFNNFLKLPSAGIRGYYFNYNSGLQGSIGVVWSSSVSTSNTLGSKSDFLRFDSVNANTYLSSLTDGLSVRCLKD